MTVSPTVFPGLLAAAATVVLACDTGAAHAEKDEETPCTEDAILVFDASGSMSGNGWGYGSENPTAISRIDKVRSALSKILPSVTGFRRVGLITYGPGPYNQCNVQLDFEPVERAADRIIAAVNKLIPAGRTPLAASVEAAAQALDFREKPGFVVLLTTARKPVPARLAIWAGGCTRRRCSSPFMSSACGWRATPGPASRAPSTSSVW